jgi:hypothetical protein
MDTNELRIGNFLEYKTGKIITVGAIHSTCVYPKGLENGCLSFVQFKPVKLNKEWFKKLGFTYYSLPTISDRKTGYYTLKYGSKFKIGRSDDNYAFSNFRKPLQYVHELQNLCFSLTAIELTVA